MGIRRTVSRLAERFEARQARKETAWDPSRTGFGAALRAISTPFVRGYEHQAARRGRFWDSVDGALGSPRLAKYRTLRLERAVTVHQPLLLISQVQRSGGTLLSQLLDGHPQVFAHPFELKWTEPKWGWPALREESPLLALRSLDEDWLGLQGRRGFYTKGQRNNWDTELASGRQPFLFDRRLQLEVFLAAAPSTPQHSRRATLDAYFTAFFNAWLDYGGLVAPHKRWVTAFVPRLAQQPGSLDAYFADYPDGLFVSCVRDPAGWLASARRHGMADPAGLEATLALWLDSTRAAIAAKERFPGKVHLLLFEDLVKNVDATMKRLCDSAGIEFDPIVLTPTFNGRAMSSDGRFAPADYVDEQVPERSRSHLTDEEHSTVERIAGTLYQEASTVTK